MTTTGKHLLVSGKLLFTFVYSFSWEIWKICQTLNLASLKASSHHSHATFNGAHSEMRNIQRPDLRWGTNRAGDCSPWAAASYLQHFSLCAECSGHAHCSHVLVPEQQLAQPQQLCNSGFLSLCETSLCPSLLCAVQENVFSWPCWFRLLLIPQWCCSDPH